MSDFVASLIAMAIIMALIHLLGGPAWATFGIGYLAFLNFRGQRRW